MRRSVAALALGALMTAGLAGCGMPEGVDGELTDDWAGLPQPASFVPAAGVCYSTDFAPIALRALSTPVDCAGDHRVETTFVGTFAGAPAGADTPPARDSDAARAAFAECDKQSATYLGADWRLGRLSLGLALPSDKAWTGGARWYRCDVTEKTNVEENGTTVVRKGSAKDGLKADDAPLRLGCYSMDVQSTLEITKMVAADCAKEHNGEFVGVWQAPANTKYPQVTDIAAWQTFYTNCRQRIADYVKVPKDDDLAARSGVAPVLANEADWKTGDRGARCYVWLQDIKINKSLRGAGPNALPVSD